MNPSAVLGFSGGVDSSYLLYAGLNCGADIKACFVKSAFQPEFEMMDAIRFAEDIGAEMAVIDKHILRDARVTLNTPDRCYHCKTSIIETLQLYASVMKIPLIIDGTNASDDETDRPGMKALAEKGVRSPLRECGITKDDVRRLSRGARLPTWNKPAYACLATRVATGITITEGLLRRIETAENALFEMGFSNFRVRAIDSGETAKLQFTKAQLEAAIYRRECIMDVIKPYFENVLLDLEGRHE
jgi:uncharacterized protein